MGSFSLQSPFFCDWWQHNQSKHKFAKNWQIDTNWNLIETTYTCLDAYHHPMMTWPPPKSIISLCFSQFFFFFSSPFESKLLPLEKIFICTLLWSKILPLWNQITSGGLCYLVCTNLKVTYHDTNWNWIPIQSPWIEEHLVHQGELWAHSLWS